MQCGGAKKGSPTSTSLEGLMLRGVERRAKPEHCLPKTQRRQSQMLNIAFASRAAGILFLGGIHITSGYGRGLSLDMGGHHASYRASPGSPLFLLAVLRCALFGDVFAAVE